MPEVSRALMAMIEADLQDGIGYRKSWMRLRASGFKIGRNRVQEIRQEITREVQDETGLPEPFRRERLQIDPALRNHVFRRRYVVDGAAIWSNERTGERIRVPVSYGSDTIPRAIDVRRRFQDISDAGIERSRETGSEIELWRDAGDGPVERVTISDRYIFEGIDSVRVRRG